MIQAYTMYTVFNLSTLIMNGQTGDLLILFRRMFPLYHCLQFPLLMCKTLFDIRRKKKTIKKRQEKKRQNSGLQFFLIYHDF